MCYCKNVEIGSYDNQIIVDAPKFMLPLVNCLGEEKEPKICLDKCIANEVLSLWNLGIRTVGCCCGHNKAKSYIQVKDVCIDKMIELGYVGPFNINCFTPKSVKFNYEQS